MTDQTDYTTTATIKGVNGEVILSCGAKPDQFWVETIHDHPLDNEPALENAFVTMTGDQLELLEKAIHLLRSPAEVP